MWGDLNAFHRPYRSMLGEHFARLCYELGLDRVRPRTVEEWLRRRDEILRGLREAMGRLADERSVKARIVSVKERGEITVENVVLETLPRFYVSGNLYRPSKVDEPLPAVLRVHGHWPYGRFQDAIQASCIGLAKRGYVVLSIDKVGYGERRFQSHWDAWWLYSVGLCLQAVELWDNMSALDYLQGRREVDPERIGVTGASGGGNQTMYLAALDERVKAAAPVCSAEVFEDQVASGRCICECIPGMLRFANVQEVLACIAPRPLLIVSGILDETFPITRARKAYLWVRSVYRLLGAEDRVSMYEAYKGHDYDREMRIAVYRWFDRWLRGVEEPVEELDVTVEPVFSEGLLCFRKGVDEGAETLLSIYLSRAKRLIRERAGVSVEEWLSRVDALRRGMVEDSLGGFPARNPLDIRTVKVEDRGWFTVEVLTYRSEWDIVVPSLLLRPKSNVSGKAMVFLSPEGKNSLFADRRVRAMLRRGWNVLLIDYRGVGETSFSEHVAAKNSIVLGRHILGMRVWDVLRAVDMLEGRFHGETGVYGERDAGLIALVAGAVDDRIAQVVAERMPSSYVSPRLKQPPSFYPPRLLNYADIPEIAALVAPRRLKLINPVDMANEALTREEAEEAFKFTYKVYEHLKATENLTIVATNMESNP